MKNVTFLAIAFMVIVLVSITTTLNANPVTNDVTELTSANTTKATEIKIYTTSSKTRSLSPIGNVEVDQTSNFDSVSSAILAVIEAADPDGTLETIVLMNSVTGASITLTHTCGKTGMTVRCMACWFSGITDNWDEIGTWIVE